MAWFLDSEETAIGVVLLDKTDNDYSGVILGRDEIGRFRAIDLETSIQTEEEANSWVIRMIKWHVGKGKKSFEQSDCQKLKPVDLFAPVVPIEKQHPYFIHLSQKLEFLSARAIIKEIMPHFTDIDGNFVEQFQSTGFDSRLWELYLYSYLIEEQFLFDRAYHSPDFVLEKFGQKIAIEAATVGRDDKNPAQYFKIKSDIKEQDNILEEHENLMPIRFGSALYSKLKKKYWELPHVEGNPLVFAIADFHDDYSMLWSSTALINYLYGIKQEAKYDQKNQLIISSLKIESHKRGEKEIPSNFFSLPESEHVSAVIFSSSGTISKFSRMGRQAGYFSPNLAIVRSGFCYNHDPNAATPLEFSYTVDETCQETWGEGLSMFHNPQAIEPINEELFPSIGHHHFRNGQIESHLPRFHPYTSVTVHVKKGKG